MSRAIDDPAAVASFYHLREAPQTGRACRGLACLAARRWAPQQFERASRDAAPIYCLGQCHAAPAVVGHEVRPEVRVVSPQATLLENVLRGPVRTLSHYLELGGGRALTTAQKMSPDELIDLVTQSELRGRGGAGFSAGRKWRAVRDAARQQSPTIVVNADEGDPGAFSDKILLEDDPFRLLEAVAIAARAIGARDATIYLRCEYPTAAEILRQALAQGAAAPWPGALDLRLVVGQGSFVCGEETSLLNALEGRRPFARTRPPYPFQHGLFGRPTLVHNVETLCAVVWIVEHGAEAYRDMGRGSSGGTKLLSLSSLFRRPGLVEVPFGMSLRQIIDGVGEGPRDGEFWGVMFGGPLAGVLPPHVWDTPFTYQDMAAIGGAVGHGGVVAFDEGTDLKTLVAEVFRFGASESCGWCVPCHQGLAELSAAMGTVTSLNGGIDRGRWKDLIDALEQTSVCGHGRGMAEFARSLERYYAEELNACLR